MFADTVLYVAYAEANLQISWKYNKKRVQEYMRVSLARSQPPNDPSRSWCGDFVYWVLLQAGVTPIPPVAMYDENIKGWNTIHRFKQTYETASPADYQAQPGDMFYMPLVPNKKGEMIALHHIGFVVEDTDGPTFKSINGNGGGNYALMVGGVKAGGFVSYSKNSKKSLVKYFIKLPE